MYQQQGYQPASGANRDGRSARRGRPLIRLAALVLVLALLAGGAYYLKAYTDVKVYESVLADNIYIDGINLSGMTPAQAVDAVFSNIEKRQNAWSLALVYQGHVYTTLTYAMMGVTTDESHAYALLNQAWALGHTGTVFERKSAIDGLRATPFSAYTAQSEMNTKTLDQALSIIADSLYAEPSDAYLVSFNPDLTDPFLIQPERYGAFLDTGALRDIVLQKASEGASGALELAPTVLYPNVYERDVRAKVALLGTGVTPVAKDSTVERTNNIRVAFSRYNGKILKPGERISFNTVVGKRTHENGFYDAVEYVSGNLEIGVGGGVCQASSTIYLATLLSDLKVNDRTPHSDPVSYTTFGQDATVYLSSNRKYDYVFTNNTDNDLYITAHVEQLSNNKYQCVVRFFGQTPGDDVYYKLRSETVQTLPAPTEPEYVKDREGIDVIYADEKMLVRKARDGMIVKTYRQRWEKGVMVSEELISTDECKARAALYKIGVTQR